MRIAALTILCSSFLLFAIQPIVAKAILPWFGGSPAVWTTCMLFFQAVLLAGYAYAHLISRWSRRAQAWTHVALLVATVLLLPVHADPAWQPAGDEDPSLRILGLLAAAVGLPYFALSSTAPLIQSWVGGSGNAGPYRLYALSNAGSLAALLGYPLGIEPLLTTGAQFASWSAGYAVFAALSALAAWTTARAAAPMPAGALPVPAARGPIALWLGLPALASVLLLAVTTQICQEVAVVPLLWLLPLTLYLVSFILCFESDRWYRRKPYLVALALLSALAFAGYVFTPQLGAPTGVLLFSAYLFVACMACHGELASTRPPVRQLTLYYLMIAAGGVAGGILVALVAPAIFSGYFELPLAIVLTLVVVLNARELRPLRVLLQFGGILLAVMTLAYAAYSLRPLAGESREVRAAVRNFYGALRVVEAGAGESRARTLSHGRTVHGKQYVDPQRRGEPTHYYSRASGAGQVLQHFRTGAPRRVAVLGLGAGTLVAYARAGDTFRCYEINPLVVDLARQEFTYLADAAGRVEIVTADARLALEREQGEPAFDVLLADVFSGDAIPVHLLTEEAFRTYVGRIAPGGVFGIHVSNRHLDLRPVVAAALRAAGWTGLLVRSEVEGPEEGETLWILAAADPGTLAGLPLVGAEPLAVERERLWRDDFSNLLQVMK